MILWSGLNAAERAARSIHGLVVLMALAWIERFRRIDLTRALERRRLIRLYDGSSRLFVKEGGGMI